MKIWELHARSLEGAIRTTPTGDADIDGLVLSEKAYLLAVRDFRPQQLVAMVRRDGPAAAVSKLIAHYGTAESQQASGGRYLVSTRGYASESTIRRNDELTIPAAAGLRTLA